MALQTYLRLTPSTILTIVQSSDEKEKKITPYKPLNNQGIINNNSDQLKLGELIIDPTTGAVAFSNLKGIEELWAKPTSDQLIKSRASKDHAYVELTLTPVPKIVSVPEYILIDPKFLLSPERMEVVEIARGRTSAISMGLLDSVDSVGVYSYSKTGLQNLGKTVPDAATLQAFNAKGYMCLAAFVASV